jgi:hypothetical protein
MSSRRGRTADVDLRAGPVGRSRDHVVAQGLHEVFGGGLLRPGGGHDGDQRRVTGGIEPWRRHRRDSRRVAEFGLQPREGRAVGA